MVRMRITVKAIRKGVPSATPNPTGRARDSVGACVVGIVELGAGHMSAIDALQSMHVPLASHTGQLSPSLQSGIVLSGIFAGISSSYVYPYSSATRYCPPAVISGKNGTM